MKDLIILLGKYLNSNRKYAKKKLPISKSIIDNDSHYDYVFKKDSKEFDIQAFDYLNKSYNSISLLDAISANSINNEGLIPISVEGDGFCLVHALSKFFFGNELFYAVIRQQILIELQDNKDWYCRSELNREIEKNEDKKIIDVNCSICQNWLNSKSINVANNIECPCNHGYNLHLSYVDQLYNDLINAAQPDVSIWSPIEHLQAFSNIIKRPICLFGSLSDMKNSNSCGTFLPLRHPPEDCFKYPIAISWHSEENKSHFVALTRTNDKSIPMIPLYCQPNLFNVPRNDYNIESNDDLLHHNEIAKKYINFQNDGSFSIGNGVKYDETEPTHLVHTLTEYEFLPTTSNNNSAQPQQGFIFKLISNIILDACKEINDIIMNGELYNDFKVLCTYHDPSVNTSTTTTSLSSSSTSTTSTDNTIQPDPFTNLKIFANLFNLSQNTYYLLLELVKFTEIWNNSLSFYYHKQKQSLDNYLMNEEIGAFHKFKLGKYVRKTLNIGIEKIIETMKKSENSTLLLNYYTRLIGIFCNYRAEIKLYANFNGDTTLNNMVSEHFIKIIDKYINKEVKNHTTNKDDDHKDSLDEPQPDNIFHVPDHYVMFYSTLVLKYKKYRIDIPLHIQSKLCFNPNDIIQISEKNGNLIFENLSLKKENVTIKDKFTILLLERMVPMGFDKEQIKLAVANGCYCVDDVMDYIEKLPSIVNQDNNYKITDKNDEYYMNIDKPLENDTRLENDARLENAITFKSNMDNKEWLNNHKAWHLRWQQKYALRKNSISKINNVISHQLNNNNNGLFRSSSLIQWLNESHEKLNNHTDDNANNNYILSTLEVIYEAHTIQRSRSLPTDHYVKTNDFFENNFQSPVNEPLTRSITDSCVETYLPNLYNNNNKKKKKNSNEPSIQDLNANIQQEIAYVEDEIDEEDEEDYNEAIKLSLLL